MRISIHHTTSYRYREPVQLGPHRLMLRPRESRDLRLSSYEVHTIPDASATWAQDVFGNAVATATFSGPTDQLTIQSVAELDLCAEPWPVFSIAACAISYPFRYSDEEWTNLGALASPCYPDEGGELRRWTRSFIRSDPTDTLSLLKDLSSVVADWMTYESREDEGTQTPNVTMERCSGSCCYYAVLFVDAV